MLVKHINSSRCILNSNQIQKGRILFNACGIQTFNFDLLPIPIYELQDGNKTVILLVTKEN